jgi:hypothetical protein
VVSQKPPPSFFPTSLELLFVLTAAPFPALLFKLPLEYSEIVCGSSFLL